MDNINQEARKVLSLTINEAVGKYLDMVRLSRSANTARTYRNAMNTFRVSLHSDGFDINRDPVSAIDESAVASFAGRLKEFSPATEQLYITAAAGFFEYLAAEKLADINLPRMRLIIRQRSRKPGKRLPQFPRKDIERCIRYANNLAVTNPKSKIHRIINMRDRAFILTLADTGLRVHEACNLRRGDIDWNEGKAIIIGKGNSEAVIRFSTRAMDALRDYLAIRASTDGASGKPLRSLPLFARHDKGTGKHVKPITTTTGRNIVKQRVKEALGEEATAEITPHSFRHYFVTTVLRGSGGNLKLAQELARHRNITVTQRYAHISDDELDKGYFEIFEEDE